MNEYAEWFDSGQIDRFATLFRRGRLVFEGMADLTGSDDVLAFIHDKVILYRGRPRTSHVLTNIGIEVGEDGVSATATSYVTVFQSAPEFPLQVIVTGRYSDRYFHDGEDWCFAERITTGGLRGDLSHHLRLGARP